MTLGDQLQAVIKLAQEAGKAILKVYEESDLNITLKSDVSPLTRADLVSHDLILTGLQKITPTLPVLSEESRQMPYEVRRGWEIFWLVDPLDGTKEFIKRNGEFTVNIALTAKGTPVLGVIMLPQWLPTDP